LVSAVAVGTTNLSATVGGIMNTTPLSVTVAPPTLQSAYLGTPGSANTMTVGGTLQFSAFCVYATQTTNCSVADIYGNAVTTWSSTDSTKATVGAVGSPHPGLATAVGAGSVNIQAVIGSRYSNPWTVTISAPSVNLASVSLAATGGVTSVNIGGTNQLKATCTYSDGSTTSCNTTDAHGNFATGWTSSNSSLATVSSSGLVAGVATGMPTFTATAGGHTSAALPLTVSVIPPGTYTITITGPVTMTGTVQF
jgi:alpha-amylase